jgi:hypothetical protein
MNVPLLGPLTFSGFANTWLFLYILVILVVIGPYLFVVTARRKRVLSRRLAYWACGGRGRFSRASDVGGRGSNRRPTDYQFDDLDGHRSCR